MSGNSHIALQDLYRSYHAIISIYLTNLCNLQCRHCGTNSDPTSRKSLKVDDRLLDMLRMSIRGGEIRMLHVSGGEPFLRRRELSALSDLALAEDVPLAVNTNGYWATSVERGTDILAKLPGISQVILSTDIYHAEWLSTEKLINAASASVACARLVDVYTVTPFGLPDAFTDGLDERLAAAGLAGRVRRFHSELGPTGRAIPLPDEELAPWQAEPAAGCCNLMNRPTVLENSTVLACCNTPAAEGCADSPLILGDIGETPLDRVLARVADDPLLKAIRVLGPAQLLNLLGSDGQAVLRESYRSGDMCTLCTDMMTDPAIVALLRERLSQGGIARIVDAAFGLECGVWAEAATSAAA
jgi:hypothetical protein